jgi:tetratricopeptide (TPR) repeat protein
LLIALLLAALAAPAMAAEDESDAGSNLKPALNPVLAPAPRLKAIEAEAEANPSSKSAKVAAPPALMPTPKNADAAAPEPQPGDALVAEAYLLTKEAKTHEQLTQVIKLCVEAMKAGVNEEVAVYVRQLSSWAFNRRGELLAGQGKEEAALGDFDKAVKIDPSHWQAYHNRGVSYALEGRFADAIDDFNRTVELNPDYANVYFNRGEVRYELGQFESAIQNYDVALELAPRDVAAHNSRGHAYYRLGDYRKAAADFTAALKLDPANAVAYANRGDLYADLGYYERALNDYQMAIKHDPKLARAYQSAAWMLATCPDEKIRNPKTALEAARRAMELDPGGDPRYLDTLAAAQASAGQYDAAQKTIRRALAAAPAETAALYRGRLALYAGKHALRAKPREAQALAGFPKQGEVQPSSYEAPLPEK